MPVGGGAAAAPAAAAAPVEVRDLQRINTLIVQLNCALCRYSCNNLI